MKSASSLKEVSLSEKLREGIGLAAMHVRGRRRIDCASLDACIAEYESVLSRHGRRRLRECDVLEIGFGSRPHRLVWLFNSGVRVWGVDLDRPLLRASPKSLLNVLRQNGAERALKSTVRYCISDAHQWRELASEFARRGRNFRIPEERLTIADASSATFWEKRQKYDFIYSEDVFEHIPLEALRRLVPRMADALRPNGLALIRPMVFTGICGGHHLEWYPHTFKENLNRRTEPWEHLRRNRFPANTFLNRLRRSDYVELFAEHFRIIEEKVMMPALGTEFMTGQIRSELRSYRDDELFSNSVLFILEPKPAKLVA